MSNIVLYTKGYCPYCHRAKALLRSKGVDFVEHDLEVVPHKRAEMIDRSYGRTTVPQIFIDDRHIGGSDDVAALNASGKLDRLLKLETA